MLGQQEAPTHTAQPHADEVQPNRRNKQRPVCRGERGAQLVRFATQRVHEQHDEDRAENERQQQSRVRDVHDVLPASASTGRRSPGESCSRAKKINPSPATTAYWMAWETT